METIRQEFKDLLSMTWEDADAGMEDAEYMDGPTFSNGLLMAKVQVEIRHRHFAGRDEDVYSMHNGMAMLCKCSKCKLQSMMLSPKDDPTYEHNEFTQRDLVLIEDMWTNSKCPTCAGIHKKIHSVPRMNVLPF